MILIFEQELPHYRVLVFAALIKHLGEEVVVCSGEIPASSYHSALSAAQAQSIGRIDKDNTNI